MKKLACSNACQNGDVSASSKIAGTCQIITVRLPASQETTRLGRQCRRNDERTPSRINGAATSMRSKCWTIWAVRSTLRRRTKSADDPDALELLPPELRRLFMLQPLSRDCFVLRILVCLSPEVCAGLLDIFITEFRGRGLRRLEPASAPL